MDVTTCEPVAAFCSSDEDGEDEQMLSFLPIAPEIEDPEVGEAIEVSYLKHSYNFRKPINTRIVSIRN